MEGAFIMEIRSLIFALLVFSGFMGGIGIFITGIGQSSGQNVQNLSYLNNAQDISNQAAALENVWQTKITGIALLDAPLVMILGFIQFIDLVGKLLFGWWFALINSIVVFLHLPSFFTLMITAGIIILIVFEIISAIIRWRT
jgi:hypothetical protein